MQLNLLSLNEAFAIEELLSREYPDDYPSGNHLQSKLIEMGLSLIAGHIWCYTLDSKSNIVITDKTKWFLAKIKYGI